MTLSNNLTVPKNVEQLIQLNTNLKIYQARGDLLNDSYKEVISFLSFDDNKCISYQPACFFLFSKKK